MSQIAEPQTLSDLAGDQKFVRLSFSVIRPVSDNAFESAMAEFEGHVLHDVPVEWKPYYSFHVLNVETGEEQECMMRDCNTGEESFSDPDKQAAYDRAEARIIENNETDATLLAEE